MTVQHRRDGSIAVVAAAGRYDLAELRAAVDAALAPFSGKAASGLILDVTESESLGSRSAEDVRTMGHFFASRADLFSRRFAMAASSDLAFGLMRLGSVLTESQGVTTHVFREYSLALAWIRASVP